MARGSPAPVQASPSRLPARAAKTGRTQGDAGDTGCDEQTYRYGTLAWASVHECPLIRGLAARRILCNADEDAPAERIAGACPTRTGLRKTRESSTRGLRRRPGRASRVVGDSWRWRSVVALGAGSVAAWQAFQGSPPNGPRILRARKAAPTDSTIATRPDCPARTGSGAYDTTLSPASGPPGSAVTVSGSLPVIAEDGADVGQTSNEVDVYWNLDYDKWWSALGASPFASVGGAPVKFLGKQDVAELCTYQVQVEIPRVAPGAYPIEVLYQGPDQGGPGFASFAPVDFQVVGG